jgi:dihydroorotate dehydrogenase (NAD+) catalytic subunit
MDVAIWRWPLAGCCWPITHAPLYHPPLVSTTSLPTSIANLPLTSPVILAAGTAGYLDELADCLDLSQVGAVVTKSITPEPREGNPAARILDSRCGMLNAIGLANVGLDHFLEHFAPRIEGVPTTVIGSIAGFRIEDYLQVAAAFDDLEHLPAVEINVSCPNVRAGTEFGSDPGAIRELIAALRPVLTRTRLFVKLSPITFEPPGLTAIARAAIDPGAAPAGPNSRPGADALVIANTIPAMEIDPETRRPRLANITGGLSGPALHPVVTRLIHQTYTQIASDTDTPIIGVGGVLNWRDAAQFILAGASALEMGTALFVDPRLSVKVGKGLRRWVMRQGVESIADLVGRVETAQST